MKSHDCDTKHKIFKIFNSGPNWETSIEVEFTCKSVYLIHEDGQGLVFSHEQFEEIASKYLDFEGEP